MADVHAVWIVGTTLLLIALQYSAAMSTNILPDIASAIPNVKKDAEQFDFRDFLRIQTSSGCL